MRHAGGCRTHHKTVQEISHRSAPLSTGGNSGTSAPRRAVELFGVGEPTPIPVLRVDHANEVRRLSLTREDLTRQAFRFLFFGEGETGLLVYAILLRYWGSTVGDDVRPRIHLLSD